MQSYREVIWAVGLGALAIVAACRSTVPADAGTETELVTQQVSDDDYEEDPVICRRQRVVGSHVPVRVCKTKSQMEAERRAMQRAIGPLRPMGGSTHQPDAPPVDPR